MKIVSITRWIAFSVIETYCSDGLGWHGDILTVVYNGNENYVEVFKLKKTGLEKITPEL